MSQNYQVISDVNTTTNQKKKHKHIYKQLNLPWVKGVYVVISTIKTNGDWLHWRDNTQSPFDFGGTGSEWNNSSGLFAKICYCIKISSNRGTDILVTENCVSY